MPTEPADERQHRGSPAAGSGAGSGAAPEISLVIPMYNEAGNVEALLRECAAVLSGRVKHEIIAVDDGSTDDTAGALRGLMRSAGLPLRVIRHAGNCGQSAAIHTGIEAARADWVVVMDGDGQYDPRDIFRLLEVRDHSGIPGLRLVCGQRQQRRDNLVKIISSRIANAVRSRMLGDRTPDTGCGLKLICRQSFLELPYFDHMHRFLPALVRRAGRDVLSVAISHRPRAAGRSKYTLNGRLWVGIIDLMGVLWLMRRSRNPVTEEVLHVDD